MPDARIEAAGSRGVGHATRALTLAAERLNLAVDLSTPRLPRVWMLRRPDGSSLGPERLYTAVPAGVMTKPAEAFAKVWTREVGPTGNLLPAR